MTAVKLYSVEVFVSIKSAYSGVEDGVTNEDIVGISVTGFLHSV